jgi:hypothetical protein
MIKEVDMFCSFADGRDLELDTVDVCLDAMEKCEVLVCAKNSVGQCLWEAYVLEPLQLQRLCDILHQQGMRASVLWTKGSNLCHAPSVDCLWEDLHAIVAWTSMEQLGGYYTSWITLELERRWKRGLRHAWLAAVVAVR